MRSGIRPRNRPARRVGPDSGGSGHSEGWKLRTAQCFPLITFRDELRARLRQARPGGGIAILAQATAAISAYLADERELGRIAADADIDSLTLSLVGGGHLLFVDRDPGPPDTTVVNKFVTAVIADAVTQRPA